MTAQVARGTGDARRSTWIKVVAVTLIAAVVAVVVGPILWPTSDPPLFPEPTATQLPFFIVLQVVTSLTFGLGGFVSSVRVAGGAQGLHQLEAQGVVDVPLHRLVAGLLVAPRSPASTQRR
jgi:H+/Cl- antiporter ClcA